jgi:UDP-N-acetylmuramoyl-tripeptide--D-alanyl-D-alanine ligase
MARGSAIGKRLGKLKNEYFVKKYLASVAHRRRMRIRGKAIGVTGSSGKSTTTALLAQILQHQGTVHITRRGNVLMSLIRSLLTIRPHTDYAVFEVATSHFSPIAPQAAILRPDIAIVTMVRDEHRTIFHGSKGVAAEKRALVDAIAANGLAVLNADDELVMGMADRSRHRVATFGRSEFADYRVEKVHAAYPERMSMSIRWAGGELPLQTRFIGEHFWLPTAAAVAAALELGLDPATIAECVAGFEPLETRCGVVEIPGGPTFFLDTTKAPLHSLQLAFDLLAGATASRKRAVVGHISDYAGKSGRTYRNAYKAARAVSDQVVFVGETAHRAKAPQEDRDQGRFHEFFSVRDAAAHIKATAQPGEVILLKGSSNLHLERIAIAMQSDVKCWKQVCGLKANCFKCNKYEFPFEQHRTQAGRRRRRRRGWLRWLNPFRKHR